LTDEIRRALSLLFEPGQVVEVRAITEEGMASGYFDDFEALEKAIEPLESVFLVHGIYVTLNEVNPALLSRRANRIKARLSRKDATTADADILRRRWFPVDIDPVRPSGVSSTDEEQESSVTKARLIARYLTEHGWPSGILAHSGNGAHLLYRIDLPNDDESRDLVKCGLEALAVMFDDAASTVDTANHNAARIWKLYGTVSRKGDHTPDRPHRRSRILEVPDTLEVVSIDLLSRLAATISSEDYHGNDGDGFDLGGWLRDHRIGVSHQKPYQGGMLYVLDDCPFSQDHHDGAFAIQFPSGAVHAGCHHTSCGGGSQRWPELRERHERGPERLRSPVPAGGTGTVPASKKYGTSQEPAPHLRRNKGTTVQKPSLSQGPRTLKKGYPNILPLEDVPDITTALSVLCTGDPKEMMLRTFALDHEGDEVVAECLILSLASRSVANTSGLHVSVTGESGKGKSHAFATLLQQVPEPFRLKGRMSNKALFYIDEMRPGSVIILDDVTLSDDMQEILKGVTTSFREPFIYRTVSKDRKGLVCTIPERCVWWVAKVEGSGDDQVFNRMLTCWIDDSPEQDARVLARVLARDMQGPADNEAVRPELAVARAMWEVIGRQRIHVIIPFSNRVRFQERSNRRNPEMLLDLVKANAVLFHRQREQVPGAGGGVSILAILEDFNEAARLYRLLNGTSGGQTTKLTKREASILELIAEKEWPEFTLAMLQKETGRSNGVLHKLIHGFSQRGNTYSGLLEKCPAISVVDRTVMTEEDRGIYMRRRANAYSFDRDLYESWCQGGSCWIDDDPDDPDSSNTSTDFHNSSTRVEESGNEPVSPDHENTDNSTHMCAHDPVLFHKCENSQKADPAQGCDAPSLCEPGNVEEIDLKSMDLAGNRETTPHSPGKPLPQSWKSVEEYPRFVEEMEEKIHAKDYKPLDRPENGPCFVCGRSTSWFVEKLTPERRARPKPEQGARRLCQHCFKAVKARDQEACRMLPGTVDVSRMEPVTVFIGRCSLCDLDQAVYRDVSTGVMLCEVCYQRELAREEAVCPADTMGFEGLPEGDSSMEAAE
jgi:hypothetical protein